MRPAPTPVVYDFGNYLETANPFGLSRPPVSFLQQMHTYDSALVIFPSMQEAVYRFCRRRTHTPPVLSLQDPKKNPDTVFIFNHRLVPITGIVPGPHWGPALLNDIAQMDMWRVGGADKAADALDRLEEAKRDRQDAVITDEADQRGISAWNALKLREKSTTFVQGYSAPK
jgi:hypothetical protein